MSSLKKLYAALGAKGVEIVEADEKTNQLRIMARLHKNYGEQWKLVIQNLLVNEAKAAWKADISKKYFLRSNQVYYAWRILLQAENVEKYYEDIARVVNSTASPAAEMIEEIPLVGARSDRNTNPNVGASGSVPIGPFAAQRKMS